MTDKLTKNSWLRRTLGVLALMAVLTMGLQELSAARLKDITHVRGVRNNQLIGYGLVVGLDKSGDDQKILFTIQSLTSMLARMGIKVDPDEIRAKNVAAVVVTAELPAFGQAGSAIDVTVSSIGNAKSLYGGTLLMTPLKGPDGNVYAVAQGAMLIGGYSFSGASGSSVSKNHPTVGRIPDGGIIEREVNVDLNAKTQIVLSLLHQDFTTAVRISETINGFLAGPFAKAQNSGSVVVQVPGDYENRVIELIAALERLQVETDRRAKVVLNERTGTVVMGADVRISTIAISHGNLKVNIQNTMQVSQPNPFGQGQTTVVPQTDISAEEEIVPLAVVEQGVSIGDLVMALNAIGVTPRDLIDILQAIKAAGALEADLEIL
jgi:flagellar P-ring protein precursor FlgI